MTRRTTRLVVALTVLLGVGMAAASLAPPALARAPRNDKFGDALRIRSIGSQDYHKEQNTHRAKAQASDPDLTCPTAPGAGNTVWFKLTPKFAANVEANTFNSNFDTVLAAFEQTGSGLGGLRPIACNDDAVPHELFQSEVHIPVNDNTTYYFMVGSCCDRTTDLGGGQLEFNAMLE